MGFEYKNVLIAVDGSDLSKKAFDRAVHIANRDNARLVLTHIIDTKHDSAIKPYLDVDQIAENSKKEAVELLNNFEDKANKSNFSNIKKVIKVGSPRRIILEEIIPDEKIDLVILGATGVSAIERILIGSVSEGVFRYSPCDVLVVR